jgi:predicted glutamine amidotransferase
MCHSREPHGRWATVHGDGFGHAWTDAVAPRTYDEVQAFEA